MDDLPFAPKVILCYQRRNPNSGLVPTATFYFENELKTMAFQRWNNGAYLPRPVQSGADIQVETQLESQGNHVDAHHVHSLRAAAQMGQLSGLPFPQFSFPASWASHDGERDSSLKLLKQLAAQRKWVCSRSIFAPVVGKRVSLPAYLTPGIMTFHSRWDHRVSS